MGDGNRRRASILGAVVALRALGAYWAVGAVEDGCTNIEAERFGAFLTAPDCLASMNPDSFWQTGVAGTSGCTEAAHDDMKDLFPAVGVHVFA